MRWPWQKKSNFDCSFYDDPKTSKIEFPKSEFDKTIADIQKSINDSWKEVEKQMAQNLGGKKMSKNVIVRRGSGGLLDERLTNKNYGLEVNLTEDDAMTLDTPSMTVALLMDIRERLDKLIELNTKPTKSRKITTKRYKEMSYGTK